MLGTVDRDHVLNLIEALAGGESAAVLETLDRVCEQSPDELSLLDALAATLHRLAIAQAVPGREADERLTGLAARFVPEDIQLYYDVALRGRRDLGDAPDPRAALEMVLLRMLLFTPEGVLPDREVTPAKKPPESAGTSPAAPAHEKPEQARHRIREMLGSGNAAEPVPSPEPVAEMQPRNEPEVQASAEPSATQDPASWWAALTDRLPLEGAVRNLARNCVLVSRADAIWHLALRPGHQVLLSDDRVRSLESGLAEYLGRPVKLQINVDEQATDTPDEIAAEQTRQRIEQARQALEQDPVVRRLVEQFDGRLDPESIRPLEE